MTITAKTLILTIWSGVASVYHPGDGFSGRVMANGDDFVHESMHFAHRTIPLAHSPDGLLCSHVSGVCAPAYCGDRGPYGAVRPYTVEDWDRERELNQERPEYWRVRRIRSGLWQAQPKLRRGWRRRGAFDINRKLADQIGHKPFERVYFIQVEYGD